jgi:hypothetical protein
MVILGIYLERFGNKIELRFRFANLKLEKAPMMPDLVVLEVLLG